MKFLFRVCWHKIPSKQISVSLEKSKEYLPLLKATYNQNAFNSSHPQEIIPFKLRFSPNLRVDSLVKVLNGTCCWVIKIKTVLIKQIVPYTTRWRIVPPWRQLMQNLESPLSWTKTKTSNFMTLSRESRLIFPWTTRCLSEKIFK